MIELCCDLAKYVYCKKDHKFEFEVPVETTKIIYHYWYGQRKSPVKIKSLYSEYSIVPLSGGRKLLSLYAIDTDNHTYDVYRDLGTGVFKLYDILKLQKDYYDVVINV